jgi:hypothetical protein
MHIFTLMFLFNYIFFDMFRKSKCSSSGGIVHVVLWYVFHTAIYAVWSMAGCTFCWFLLRGYFTVTLKFTACLINKAVVFASLKDYYIYR